MVKSLPEDRAPSPAEPADGRPAAPFPVVAIGASAGGLRAFRQLLDHLPPDTNMAYVLIPHLDPTHESSMSEILGRTANIPIVEVEPGARVKPNHAYVIRPNTILTISGDKLDAVVRGKPPGRKHECIDHFMISLAQEYRERAIGIVLSGNASDGSAGTESIKSEGGITFAQDDTAEFKDMPRNAIATGAVDFVLPPRRIAEELVRISRHPYLGEMTSAPEESRGSADEEGTTKIFHVLRGATGVDFAQYKQSTLERRIARRMALVKEETLAGYARRLEGSPEEVRVLYDDLLINVTSFFREPGAFEALRAKVYPLLLRDREANDPVRFWIPGCSTGEESYSLAISMLEFMHEMGARFDLQIFGTDVSERAIEKARAGVYNGGIQGDVSEDRLRRYFTRGEGGAWQISKSVRDLCVFARQDLARDPPFSRIDLLSCRNVLIYLGLALQKRVLPLFHFALKSSGFLMLGSSESLNRHASLFAPVDQKHRIYSKVPGPTAPRISSGTEAVFPRKAGFVSKNDGDEGFDVSRAADRLLLSHHVPASIVVNAEGQVIEIRGEPGTFLRPAPGKPSHSVLKMVHEDLAMDVDSAVREARKKGVRVRRERVRFRFEKHTREATIDVVPIPSPAKDGRYVLVLFTETAPGAPTAPDKAPGKKRKTATGPAGVEAEVARLKSQLIASQEHQQTVIEKLEAANEELRSASEETLSANEELQSTNEEIETSKEELQSANEELTTLNDELRNKNLELGQLTSDLGNVLVGANVPLAIVDTDLRLRRFTPHIEKLLNIHPLDAGRRITDFATAFRLPNLDRIILGVIEHLAQHEEEVQDAAGRWYLMRVRPYRSPENKIEGAVVVFHDVDALKKGQMAIEENRNYCSAILDTIRDPLLGLGEGFRVESANRAFYRMFQTSGESTIGKPIFELGTGQWNFPRLRELLAKVVADDTTFEGVRVEHDFKLIGRKVVLLSARRIVSDGARAPSILLAIEDITELERIRTQKDGLAAVVESSDDAILTTAPDGTIRSWNQGARKMFGIPAEEVIGTSGWDLASPATREEEKRLHDLVVRTGRAQSFLATRRRKDGMSIHVSLSISPILDGAGKVAGTSTIARDVTEKVRAERALGFLAESSAILGSTLDLETSLAKLAQRAAAGLCDWCAIHLVRDDGTTRRITTAHRDPARLKEVEDALDRHASPGALLRGHPKVLQTGVSDFIPAIADLGGTGRPDDLPFFRSLAVGSFLSVPMSARGKVLGAISMALNESSPRFGPMDLALAEEVARRAAVAADNAALLQNAQASASARDRFLSIASHELKTPLTTLQLQLQMARRALRKGFLSPDHRGEFEGMVDMAERQGNRIGRLIEELLDVTRITSGKLVLVPEAVDLAVLARDVAEQFGPAAQEQSVSIEVRAPRPVHGQWDRLRLEQVLSNLLSNALKFGNGGAVAVDVQGEAERAILTVRDEGIGIPADVVRRLFRPFEQGVPAKHHGGLGLGLFIARHIVELHGGSIRVASEANRGSTFTVELPLQPGALR